MLRTQRPWLLLSLMLLVFTITLARVDRLFFKRNHSFCVRFIYPGFQASPEWEVPLPSPAKIKELDPILKQKFHYLAKGAHCYAFLSEDQKYVIKFHRFASHLRRLPWLNHPLSYYFSEKRRKIKEHNLQRLGVNMQSYLDSAKILKEETGIILAHTNPSRSLHRSVTIVDVNHSEYRIPLDEVTFILQHKASLIYPTLDQLLSEKKIEEAKKVVTQIIQLITDCCKKGYVDEDPILRKNYGLIAGKAIHIDVGDLVRREAIQERQNYIPHVKEMTESFRVRLEKQYPELLAHYHQEIEKL